MFKTIHECGLELVSYTETVKTSNLEGGVFMEDRLDSDYLPVSAARASFGKQDKTGENVEADEKLMKYLAAHEHLTPFEYQHATFLIECPLFIRSQIHRHRTFSYNEISRRYTSENLEFWIPDKFRKQSKSNKQASDGVLSEEEQDGMNLNYILYAQEALDGYNYMIQQGVCREQARAVLPQSLLTRFYMGGNLRNWAHFIRLRKDSHAQYEVRVIAEKIEKELRDLWPKSVEALLGYRADEV